MTEVFQMLWPHGGGGGDRQISQWAFLSLLVFLYLQEHSTKVHGVRGFGVQAILFQLYTVKYSAGPPSRCFSPRPQPCQKTFRSGSRVHDLACRKGFEGEPEAAQWLQGTELRVCSWGWPGRRASCAQWSERRKHPERERGAVQPSSPRSLELWCPQRALSR